MNTLAIYLAHIILKKICKNKNTTGEGQIKILVVSSEKYAGETIEKLLNGPDKSFDIIGISLIDGDGSMKDMEGIPVVANGTEVYEYACRSAVDSVLLCEDMNRQEEIEEMTNKFLQMGITVNVKMNMFAGGLPNVSFGHINDISILTTSIKTISYMCRTGRMHSYGNFVYIPCTGNKDIRSKRSRIFRSGKSRKEWA